MGLMINRPSRCIKVSVLLMAQVDWIIGKFGKSNGFKHLHFYSCIVVGER